LLGETLVHREVMEEALDVGAVHVLAGTVTEHAVVAVVDDLRAQSE